jgi:hypothetical protein
MKLERFRYLLDAYGADLQRWPEAERASARELLARSDEAAQAQYEAARLDYALGHGAPAVSGAAVGRVLKAVAEPEKRTEDGLYRAVIGPRWVPPALLGGMAVLGFLVGLVDLESDSAASGMRSDVVAIVFNSDLAGKLGL